MLQSVAAQRRLVTSELCFATEMIAVIAPALTMCFLIQRKYIIPQINSPLNRYAVPRIRGATQVQESQ